MYFRVWLCVCMWQLVVKVLPMLPFEAIGETGTCARIAAGVQVGTEGPSPEDRCA